MTLTVEQLVSCMTWAAENGLSKATRDIGHSRVTIRRGGAAGPIAAPATALSVPSAAPQDQGGVTAPLSGICHLAPEPGAPHFVSLGDPVVAGQTLCLIEAMKLMTPVTATQAGTITAILIEDGDSVEAEHPVMRIAS